LGYVGLAANDLTLYRTVWVQIRRKFFVLFKRFFLYAGRLFMPNTAEKKKAKKTSAKWTRTTVLIREDHLEKFKILAWWEKSTIKDLFDEMIEMYLSSKNYIDGLIKERERVLEEKNSNPDRDKS
jgi:hypothetical protein